MKNKVKTNKCDKCGTEFCNAILKTKMINGRSVGRWCKVCRKEYRDQDKWRIIFRNRHGGGLETDLDKFRMDLVSFFMGRNFQLDKSVDMSDGIISMFTKPKDFESLLCCGCRKPFPVCCEKASYSYVMNKYDGLPYCDSCFENLKKKKCGV